MSKEKGALEACGERKRYEIVVQESKRTREINTIANLHYHHSLGRSGEINFSVFVKLLGKEKSHCSFNFQV